MMKEFHRFYTHGDLTPYCIYFDIHHEIWMLAHFGLIAAYTEADGRLDMTKLAYIVFHLLNGWIPDKTKRKDFEAKVFFFYF